MQTPNRIGGQSGAARALVIAARAGYFAKGFLYAGIGMLAGLAALGRAGGQTTGINGALQELTTHAFGSSLLGLAAAGLAGHVLWRFYQAFADPARKGTDPKGLLMRSGFAVSGLIYASTALFAFRMLLGQAAGSSDETSSHTAALMSRPGGVWLVAAVGIGVIGVGLYQFYRAYRASFENKWLPMSNDLQCWATRLSRVGIAARALVFLMSGGFLVLAAWRSDPGAAKGIGGALAELAEQPHGRYLLGAAAVGLICYGVYCALNGRYRRIQA